MNVTAKKASWVYDVEIKNTIKSRLVSPIRILPSSGIYTITNPVNNKVYVGSSVKCSKRCNTHRHELVWNKHENSHLQRSYNKNNTTIFIFEVLEYCPIDKLFEKEQYWFNIYKSNSYNQRVIVESNKGLIRTKEQKNNNRNKVITEQTRMRMRIAQTGKIIPLNVRLKISKAQIGKIAYNVSAATEAKLKKIQEINEFGDVINEWPSLKQCSNELKVKSDTVRRIAQNAGCYSRRLLNRRFIYG